MSALSRSLRCEAIRWLAECFDDMPAGLTDAEVIAAVNRHYDGGWSAFLIDSVPS